ncbi:MAG: bifunctional 3-deoxy-7-phosphoheptulonate synthase/chorismate mutase [Bacteroidota bacterium]
MIIQLEKGISADKKAEILSAIQALGYKPNEVNTSEGDYLVSIGKAEFDIRKIGQLAGVKDIHRVSDAYKLVSRKWKVNATSIDLGNDVTIEEGKLAIMAGPCSIESEAQIEETLKHLQAQGIRIMRGGVYKPRSSPYSFRGLGIEGLKIWHQLANKYGIKIITEVMQVSQIEHMIDYIDIFQVGARNMQNFNLLDALGSTSKPVLIKRAMSGTLEELLHCAEYVFSAGNEKLMLCERGIRTYEKAYRNTFDMNAIPILKEKSHLPVIADPSHGIGLRDYVEPVALAAVMAGADGVIYETHRQPEKAFSDGQQTLNFSESAALVDKMRKTFALKQSF